MIAILIFLSITIKVDPNIPIEISDDDSDSDESPKIVSRPKVKLGSSAGFAHPHTRSLIKVKIRTDSQGTQETKADSVNLNYTGACTALEKLRSAQTNDTKKSILDRIFNIDYTKSTSLIPVKNDSKPDCPNVIQDVMRQTTKTRFLGLRAKTSNSLARFRGNFYFKPKQNAIILTQLQIHMLRSLR